MKEIITEWRKYVTEAIRNFFDRNVGLIYYNARSYETGIDNQTIVFIQRSSEEEFKNLLIECGVDKILKDYQLDKNLGIGRLGVVYTLKYPHENYVFKFQITEKEDLENAGGEMGTEYPAHLYSKQEKDNFDPKEMRVLESIRNFAHNAKGEVFFVSGIIMSKLSKIGASGITTEEIMRDIIKTQMKFILMSVANYHKGKRDLRTIEAIKNNFVKYKKDDAKTLMELIEAGEYEQLFRLIYQLNKTSGKIKYMDEKQFVNFALQLLKIMSEGDGYVDLHDGNFGFRPNSDDVMFFDI